MPVQYEVIGDVKYLGYRRGAYKLRIKHFDRLPRNEEVEDSIFEIGDCKWKILIVRSAQRGRSEDVTVYLFSCNCVGVLADIKMYISPVERAQMPLEEIQRKAFPFSWVRKISVPLKCLRDRSRNNQIVNELLVEVEFKDVERVPDVELTLEIRNIKVEVIDADSIRQVLHPRIPVKGVVSTERNESHSVYKYSSVNLWASWIEDRRYWLCERCENGSLVGKGCLNRVGALNSFADICRPGNRAIQWVTVFMEKKGDDHFTPVYDNSILVFLKLQDSVCNDYSYLGHRIVRKSMRFYEFLESVIETAALQSLEPFKVFLETDTDPQSITNHRRSLQKCGVDSGSVIILMHRALGQFPAVDGSQNRSLVHCFVRSVSPEVISSSKDSSETVPSSSAGGGWILPLVQSKTVRIATGLAMVAIISMNFFRRQIRRRQRLQLQLSSLENEDFWAFLEIDKLRF